MEMVCANCGKKLIRGYAFCLECGSPVPPEVLEEGGMPGRTDNEGRPPKSETESASPEDTAEETLPEEPVGEVKSSMPGVEPLDGGNSEETLVFCPNCGMHMQKNPYQCDKCGMTLGDRPKNIPLSRGGVPLMNPDETAIGGGGIGGFGMGLDGVSDSDIEQLNSFMNGSGVIPIFHEEEPSAPDLFGTGISANDFAALSEQIDNFKNANDMPSVDAVERDPKRAAGTDRRIDNFSMTDDGAETAMFSENSVPVIGGYSMDENPSENVNLDPYKFLNNSMEDIPSEIPDAKSSRSVISNAEPIFTMQPETVKQEPEPEKAQPIINAATAKPVQEPAPEPTTEPASKPERMEFEPLFASSAPPRMVEETPKPPRMVEEAPKPPRTVEEAPKPPRMVEEEPKPRPEQVQPLGSQQPQAFPQNPQFAQPKPQNQAAAPVISENAPITNEYTAPTVQQPQNNDNRQVPRPAQEVPHGNMFRCQNCGQSMYDTDKFCPNCGVPYSKAAKSPRKKSKLPLIIIIAVVIVIAAAVFFVVNSLSGNAADILPVMGLFADSEPLLL